MGLVTSESLFQHRPKLLAWFVVSTIARLLVLGCVTYSVVLYMHGFDIALALMNFKGDIWVECINYITPYLILDNESSNIARNRGLEM